MSFSTFQYRNSTDTYRRAFANSLGKGVWFHELFHPGKARAGKKEDAEMLDSDSDTDEPPVTT
jgi:hypothetical protein